MRAWVAVLDRTVVLFLGIAAGLLIGLSFHDEATSDAPLALPAPVVAPGASPPPPGPGVPRIAPAKPGEPVVIAAPAAPEVIAVLDPAGSPSQQVFDTVKGDAPIRVGVFGDSFGDGVWSGLNRLLPRKAGYQVVKYSQQATGFTRYKSLNLEQHVEAQLGANQIDVAVISYGANDTQGVYTGGGHAAALLTPAWQAEIGARVERYVGILRRHGAMVYWVGLPRMRKASFDGDIQRMNAFYAAKMAQLGVPFIDTRPYASDAAGNYAAYLPDPKDGHQVLMRADDGIHMSMNGYVWITRGLAGRIRAYVDAARQRSGVAVAPQPAPERIVNASSAARPVVRVAPPKPAPAPKPAAPVETPPVTADKPPVAVRVDPPRIDLTPADLGEPEPARKAKEPGR